MIYLMMICMIVENIQFNNLKIVNLNLLFLNQLIFSLYFVQQNKVQNPKIGDNKYIQYSCLQFSTNVTSVEKEIKTTKQIKLDKQPDSIFFSFSIFFK